MMLGKAAVGKFHNHVGWLVHKRFCVQPAGLSFDAPVAVQVLGKLVPSQRLCAIESREVAIAAGFELGSCLQKDLYELRMPVEGRKVQGRPAMMGLHCNSRGVLRILQPVHGVMAMAMPLGFV